MQLFIQSNDKTFPVVVQEDATLNDLKFAIEDVEFIPSALQRITKNSLTITEGYLEDVVEEGDLLVLNLDVDGGMRAKWRKKRMRRLRRKRRKMRLRAQ